IPGQDVSPALPFAAVQQPMVAEGQQNALEKLLGNLLLGGEVADPNRSVGTVLGEREQRFDGVFRFLGKHGNDEWGTGNGAGGQLPIPRSPFPIPSTPSCLPRSQASAGPAAPRFRRSDTRAPRRRSGDGSGPPRAPHSRRPDPPSRRLPDSPRCRIRAVT